MIAGLTWNLYLKRIGAAKQWESLSRFQSMSPDLQRAILSEKLLAQIKYFASRHDALPEWKEAATASRQEIMDLWPSLPVLTKAIVKERFDAHRLKTEYGISGPVESTGGSTGEPTKFIRTPQDQLISRATTYYVWKQFGWSPGMPYMCLWGAPREIGREQNLWSRIRWRMRDYTLVDGYKFSESTVVRTKALLDKHDQIAMYGFTSLLEQLAREFIARGYEVPSGKIKAAWNGGEALHQTQDDLFRTAFHTGIQDLYGGRELSTIAYKPSGSDSYRLARPNLFIEVVDENGRLVQPGEPGRILVTSLIGKGTPFLRYEIGDVATYGEDDYDESGIARLRTLEGRITGLITLPNGAIVHNLFWNGVFKAFHEIEGFHVHQAKDGAVQISLLGKRLPEQGLSLLQTRIRDVVGTVPVTITYVEALPRTPGGKHLRITSEYQPSCASVIT